MRSRSQSSLSDEVLGAQVHQSFVRSDRTYGARRVWHDVLEQGQSCGLHRIKRLMREQALRARPRRRGLPKDRGARSAVADSVLDRQFQAAGPNQKWVADFTYIWTAEGWLYVAAVLDLYSRRIVGWSMQESMTSQLVVDALMMAVWRRGKPVALLHHSDQGSQYTSEHFQKLLDHQGITCSMSRAGEVWDNSAMESFFSSLKTERTARKVSVKPGQLQSASTTRRAGIRRSAISVPYSSSKLKKLRRCPRNRQQPIQCCDATSLFRGEAITPKWRSSVFRHGKPAPVQRSRVGECLRQLLCALGPWSRSTPWAAVPAFETNFGSMVNVEPNSPAGWLRSIVHTKLDGTGFLPALNRWQDVWSR